jgi:hypothetical protein
MRTIRFSSFVVAILLSIVSLQAATFVVPPDAALIDAADDIVIGTAVTSVVERNERGAIVTRSTLRIEQVLKGHRSVDSYLVLTERGGRLGDTIKYIPGTPQYVAGERYLVFTDASAERDVTTLVMVLGQFRIVDDGGRQLAVRSEIYGFDQNLEPHRELVRDVRGFVAHIRGVLSRTAEPSLTYFVDEPAERFAPASNWTPETNAGRGIYLTENGGSFFRWSPPTATFVRSGLQPVVDGPASVTKGFQQWNSTDSDIDYDDGGVDESATGGLDDPDQKNGILFNTPLAPPFSSAAAIGGISEATGPYTLEGESFWKMKEVDVVVNNAGITSQSCMNSVMTHELGHTLGFKHAAEKPDNVDAMMNWQVQCGWNGVLRQYDKDAAAIVYGSGCSQPSISTHPQNKTIFAGATTSLSVTASGTAPVTYQWYIGTAPDTSAPTGTNASTLSNLSPTTTTSYWVKVTNACGSVSSNTATVTVQSCTPPSITTQPQPKTISIGGAANMSVVAAGTSPFTYQWYIGNSGDTSNPISGARSASPSISLSATASVWVRVTGQCNPPADSNAVTITVNACADVVVGTPTATGAGTNWTLSVTATSTASGALTYEWYRGSNPGSTSAPKVGEGQSLPVTVTTLTRYWAKVTNSCGTSKASDLVVVAPCELPVIATQPADRTIPKNGSTQLTVATTGDGIAIQWYQGIAPDKSAPLPAGAAVTVGPLQATASYWASLTNTCGEISTRTVTVTVDESCSLAAITTQPQDRTVSAGTSTELAVAFTGENTTVQWYRGTAPDKSNPLASGAAVQSGPILETTSFWAALTNACGEVATRTVVVSVEGQCVAPSIATALVIPQEVKAGETVTLTANASGTPVLHYQWYEGELGVTTKPVGTDSATFTTPPIFTATKYWVKVTNACGETSAIVADLRVAKGRRRAARS